MNPYEFARAHLGEFKQHGSEIIPKYCPFCHGGDRHDKYTFALNVNKLTFNCKRGTCGRQGHFTELCREFGEQADREEQYEYRRPVKNYTRPKTKVDPAREKVEAYLRLRGFSKETWERRGVGESGGNIGFPYYENGELVLVKFRKPEKYNGQGQKAWRESGGKAVLWGMDLCDTTIGQIVVVEGEFDALALDECGVKNVVSVPSGAEDLTWIDNCWDWLQKFDSIVFWGDNDEPGRRMVDNCIKRLSDWKIYVVDSKYKDANVSLALDGKEKTADAVKNARLIPRAGLLDLGSVVPVDSKNVPRVPSGLVGLDHTIGGFLFGELSVWTGRSGHGKSTLLGQILLNAIDDGMSVCAYSGELRADRFQYWIDLQCAGPENIETYFDSLRGRDIPYIPRDIREKIHTWYGGRFWLYDNGIENAENAGILKLFEYAAKRYGVKVFLIDNLMTAKYGAKSDSDFYRAQSSFVGELVHFVKAYGVHVHLVSHPRKTQGKLEKESVSGSGDIVNRADNVFSVERSKETESSADTVITILKNRSDGVQDVEIGLNFDVKSKRFYGLNANKDFSYGWENSGDSMPDAEIVQEVF